MALTQVQGVMRKPVTGEARTGRRECGAATMPDDERSEADGVSGVIPTKAASRVGV